MDKFLASYIETALWSTTDEDGVPLDNSKYSDAELHPKTLERFKADCEKFILESSKILACDTTNDSHPTYHIAHDFWLTRNRHGAGFWDGDYPEPIATKLTELAHSFGECDLYVGDDNKFYL